MPRSILMDLEPRVIERIQSSEYGRLYNRENMFVGADGGGAGNNWAKGYDEGLKVQESVMEKIEREAENSDSLEAFILCHSISGGTGSGEKSSSCSCTVGSLSTTYSLMLGSGIFLPPHHESYQGDSWLAESIPFK